MSDENGKVSTGIYDKDMPESERRQIALLNGAKPRNEEEKKIVAENEKIIKEGGIPWIPSN